MGNKRGGRFIAKERAPEDRAFHNTLEWIYDIDRTTFTQLWAWVHLVAMHGLSGSQAAKYLSDLRGEAESRDKITAEFLEQVWAIVHTPDENTFYHKYNKTIDTMIENRS
jgi:hypothetical protein